MQSLPKAAFSLKNYLFDRVSIDLTNVSNKELAISFDPTGVFKKESLSFELLFWVRVSCAGTSEPFVQIRCKGVFDFEQVADLSSVPDFFYNNSIAILFPYIRAYLSVVTAQANIPGIILPTLNLSSLGEVLKKHTILE